MKKIGKNIGLVVISAMLISISISSILTQNVRASDYNITVRWDIPGDYSVSISYPTGQGMILFEPTGQNFTLKGATGQDDSPATWAINLTNTGNAAIDVSANFTSGAMATGITRFAMSVTWGGNEYTWGTGNATTPVEIKDNLAVDGYARFYANTTGVNVPEGQVDKSLHISTAAHT